MPQEWPKHVADHNAVTLRLQNQSSFVGFLIRFMHLINVWNMEHIKL